GLGPRARDREFAGKKARMPTIIVGPICGCARDHCLLAEARTQDSHRTTPQGGVGHCCSGSVDPRARSVYQLAGAKKQGTWFTIGTRSIPQCKRERSKAGGTKWAGRAARGGKGAFSYRA